MMPRLLRSSAGFTYITVLMMVVVTGIMAARGALVWKTVVQREKEAELIFRGKAIREAMQHWYRVKVVADKGMVEPIDPKAPKPPNLPELKALLKDPNVAGTQRYLRPHALIDPMTGKEWAVVQEGGQIVGVKSTSVEEPFKKSFKSEFDLHPADFDNKKMYSEWEFRYNRVPPGRTESTNNPNLPAGG